MSNVLDELDIARAQANEHHKALRWVEAHFEEIRTMEMQRAVASPTGLKPRLLFSFAGCQSFSLHGLYDQHRTLFETIEATGVEETE